MATTTCTVCNGRGQLMNGADDYGLPKWRTCPNCSGSGRVPDFSATSRGTSASTGGGCAVAALLAAGLAAVVALA